MGLVVDLLTDAFSVAPNDGLMCKYLSRRKRPCPVSSSCFEIWRRPEGSHKKRLVMIAVLCVRPCVWVSRIRKNSFHVQCCNHISVEMLLFTLRFHAGEDSHCVLVGWHCAVCVVGSDVSDFWSEAGGSVVFRNDVTTYQTPRCQPRWPQYE